MKGVPTGAPGLRETQEPAAPAASPPPAAAQVPLTQDNPPVPFNAGPTGRDEEVSSEDSPPAPVHEVLPLDEIEKRHILATLRHTTGNRTRAAGLLGISIRTLRNKLQEYRADGTTIEGDDSAAE